MKIKSETIVIMSMSMSILSMFSTFWSYHTRSKKNSRHLLSLGSLIQMFTWMLLIATKIGVYVFSFINYPGLFFVPVLIQFSITFIILSYSKISPIFRAFSFHDRVIHCLVSCVLPLAVS